MMGRGKAGQQRLLFLPVPSRKSSPVRRPRPTPLRPRRAALLSRFVLPVRARSTPVPSRFSGTAVTSEETAMPFGKGRSAVTALFAVAVAFVFAAAPAQAQCRSGSQQGSGNARMATFVSPSPMMQTAVLRQQYATLAALQQQQQNALIAAAWQQQQQYAALVAWQQQQQYAALVAAQQQLQQQNALLAAAAQQQDAMLRAAQVQGRR